MFCLVHFQQILQRNTLLQTTHELIGEEMQQVNFEELTCLAC